MLVTAGRNLPPRFANIKEELGKEEKSGDCLRRSNHPWQQQKCTASYAGCVGNTAQHKCALGCQITF